ncbi:unnamed protein product [Brassicogethes aeneus]|uniref:RRM domain-containing protein n=1 Tax=Brassicogethes aeneus TaxID=1431903 RepID=A0A9P0BEL5_BRAAE|nr:unnamed protein product [Brassicogethes aeneus]
MFSIFNTKTKKTHEFDKDFEPPSKKLVTEGDLLIKKLSEKQLEKKTTLAKQLNATKEFVGSSEFVPVTNRLHGVTPLSYFENETNKFDVYDKYKSLGLSEQDIQLYEDNLKGFGYVLSKHRNINSDILMGNIKRIEKVIFESTTLDDKEINVYNIAKQKAEDLFSVKPDSTETKLLKFALNNEGKKEKLPHPMDNIQEVENNLNKNVDLFSSVDVKKIRKKARSLARQINELNQIQPIEYKNNNKSRPITKNSKWDKQETQKEVKVHENKLYSCKKQSLYTIKDGKIVQIQGDSKIIDTNKKPNKLTIKEIKSMDKFKNYEPGDTTSKLYLKNMHKNVEERDLFNLLTDIDKNNIISIDLMKGKMKGQGFIQFKDENIAKEALILLNGILLRNKPIIVQYSKK